MIFQESGRGYRPVRGPVLLIIRVPKAKNTGQICVSRRDERPRIMRIQAIFERENGHNTPGMTNKRKPLRLFKTASDR